MDNTEFDYKKLNDTDKKIINQLETEMSNEKVRLFVHGIHGVGKSFYLDNCFKSENENLVSRKLNVINLYNSGYEENALYYIFKVIIANYSKYDKSNNINVFSKICNWIRFRIKLTWYKICGIRQDKSLFLVFCISIFLIYSGLNSIFKIFDAENLLIELPLVAIIPVAITIFISIFIPYILIVDRRFTVHYRDLYVNIIVKIVNGNTKNNGDILVFEDLDRMNKDSINSVLALINYFSEKNVGYVVTGDYFNLEKKLRDDTYYETSEENVVTNEYVILKFFDSRINITTNLEKYKRVFQEQFNFDYLCTNHDLKYFEEMIIPRFSNYTFRNFEHLINYLNVHYENEKLSLHTLTVNYIHDTHIMESTDLHGNKVHQNNKTLKLLEEIKHFNSYHLIIPTIENIFQIMFTYKYIPLSYYSSSCRIESELDNEQILVGNGGLAEFTYSNLLKEISDKADYDKYVFYEKYKIIVDFQQFVLANGVNDNNQLNIDKLITGIDSDLMCFLLKIFELLQFYENINNNYKILFSKYKKIYTKITGLNLTNVLPDLTIDSLFSELIKDYWTEGTDFNSLTLYICEKLIENISTSVNMLLIARDNKDIKSDEFVVVTRFLVENIIITLKIQDLLQKLNIEIPISVFKQFENILIEGVLINDIHHKQLIEILDKLCIHNSTLPSEFNKVIQSNHKFNNFMISLKEEEFNSLTVLLVSSYCYKNPNIIKGCIFNSIVF